MEDEKKCPTRVLCQRCGESVASEHWETHLVRHYRGELPTLSVGEVLAKAQMDSPRLIGWIDGNSWHEMTVGSDAPTLARALGQPADDARALTRLRLAIGQLVGTWQQQIIYAREQGETARGSAERVRAREQAGVLEAVCVSLMRAIGGGE